MISDTKEDGTWVVCETDVITGGPDKPTEEATEYHVMPIGDLKDHTTTHNCWCRPRLDGEWLDMYDKHLYVHNSYDRREHTYEKGKTH